MLLHYQFFSLGVVIIVYILKFYYIDIMYNSFLSFIETYITSKNYVHSFESFHKEGPNIKVA